MPKDIVDEKLIPYLSFHIRRNQNLSGEFPAITMKNWKELALREKAVIVPQKLEKLLTFISEKTEIPGRQITINKELDGAVFCALDAIEAKFLLISLCDQGFITFDRSSEIILITAKGLQQLMPIPNSEGIPGRCFVAMWFDKQMDLIFNEAIYPAAKACSFGNMREYSISGSCS